jgi:poly(hydroxyalkanoate) depolymerase family esterase
MKYPLTRGMAEATRLTQSGNLAEATALIQSLLSDTTPTPDDDVIDGAFTRVDTPPHPTPRRPLAETLRWIQSGGMPGHTPAPGAPDQATPAGATFTSHQHSGPQGSRDYKLYLPTQAAEGSIDALPLVIMLHGCTQSPDDFASGTGMNALAEELGAIIAYPGQPSSSNANKCWNWFNPGDQARDKGEPALIAGLTKELVRDHPVDPARVYVAGLSAGGAAAAIVAQAYPDLYAAVGVHSGLPVGAASDVPSAFAAMRNGAPGKRKAKAVPTIIFHGDADSTVHPSNGTALARQSLSGFAKVTPSVTSGTAAGGRKYRRTIHAAPDGRPICEHWLIEGAGHAWSGGHPSGSYTDPTGPDASRELMRFFLQHRT